MKAMIFAAGLGTRLKPLTNTMPKALVPVAGKPMLAHVIGKLKAAGFDELVINVHHFADQIRTFLRTNDNFGLSVAISDETEELLDTGGGLQKASPLLGKDETGYLIHNVDILSNCHLDDLMQHHSEHRAHATLLVSQRKTARYLLFDDENRLQGWINKDTGKTKPEGFVYEAGKYREYAYSGILVVSPSLFPTLPAGKFSIIDFYLTHCHELDIRCYAKDNLRLIDIGKPDTLVKAEDFLEKI